MWGRAVIEKNFGKPTLAPEGHCHIHEDSKHQKLLLSLGMLVLEHTDEPGLWVPNCKGGTRRGFDFRALDGSFQVGGAMAWHDV